MQQAQAQQQQQGFTLSRQFIGRFGIFFAIVIVAAVFGVLTDGVFLSPDNLANIGRQTAILAITAFAMTFVIISGEIDISIGATASMASVVIAAILREAIPFPFAILAGVAAGAFVGLLNGLLTVKGGLPSFIVTLGTLNAVEGVALAATNASTIIFDNALYRDLFSRAAFLGIPAAVWFVVVLFSVLHYVLSQTRFGANIYAVGGNSESARLAGISVDRIKIIVFVLSGALTALAAVVLTARVGNGQAEAQLGRVLDAIAAVVLGGTSFTGGRGSLVRTVFGALLIGMLNNGLTLMSVNFNMQLVTQGVVIVLAVYLDYWTRKRSENA